MGTKKKGGKQKIRQFEVKRGKINVNFGISLEEKNIIFGRMRREKYGFQTSGRIKSIRDQRAKLCIFKTLHVQFDIIVGLRIGYAC